MLLKFRYFSLSSPLARRANVVAEQINQTIYEANGSQTLFAGFALFQI